MIFSVHYTATFFSRNVFLKSSTFFGENGCDRLCTSFKAATNSGQSRSFIASVFACEYELYKFAINKWYCMLR